MKAIDLAMLACLLVLGGCQKVGSEMSCGGETFKVDFGDKAANVTSSDKSSASLPLLERPSAAGAAKVYTNGVMTFTRLEPAGAAPIIKFARGRMAFEDCQLAAS
jgi:hypothetical protein